MNAFKWITSLFAQPIGGDEHYTTMQDHAGFEFSSGNPSATDLSWDSETLTPDFMTQSNRETEINPASGLPMIGGIAGVDYAGNPYGIDYSNSDEHHVGLSIDSHSSTDYGDMFDHGNSLNSSGSWD